MIIFPGFFKGQNEVQHKDKKLSGFKELHKEALDVWFGLSRLKLPKLNWKQGWFLSSFTADPKNEHQDHKTSEGCATQHLEMYHGRRYIVAIDHKRLGIPIIVAHFN